MRILFLSRWFPSPANNGSKVRILSLLNGLADRHKITLISFYAPQDGEPDIQSLEAFCEKVIPIPRREFNPRSLKSQLGFLSPAPRSVIDTFSHDIETAILTELNSEVYDLVIASQFDMALYAKSFSGLPSIFEEVELGVYLDQFQNAQGVNQRARHGLMLWKHKRFLARLLDQFSAFTVVSEKEREILQGIRSDLKSIVVVPNCVELADYDKISGKSPIKRNQLIFTGSLTYEPNYQAMVWFISSVFPRVLANYPDLELVITGDHAGRPLPSQINVKLTGFVNDVRSHIAGSWISLAPIHQGGGTRLKILEAMALHTAVVATPKGAEGLDVEHENHLLLASHPDEFAQACCQLLASPELRERLTRNAYTLVQQKYDWQSVMPEFLNLASITANHDFNPG